MFGFFKKALNLGNWRVVYPDGNRSRPMCYETAKDYAKMFGGHITPTDDPIYDLGLRREAR